MPLESPSISGPNSSQSFSNFDSDRIADVFTSERKRLIQVVQFRLDYRLHGRIDPDDVLQEAYLDSVKRLRHFHDRISLFVQVREILLQTLTDVHRRHLAVQARDVSREESFTPVSPNVQSTMTLSRLIQARVSSPSSPLKKAETHHRLNLAIESLGPLDCEVLLMRHFEDLTNAEVAEALNLKPVTACKRYLRALERLKNVLETQSHFSD